MREKLALFGGRKTVTLSPPPYPVIGPEEVAAATRVVMAGHLSEVGRGGSISEMEDAFAQYFGAKYALSFGSGTDSIHGALFAVGVRPGTEVLTANHTWISAITAVCHAGGTPVFCDIKKGAFAVDPAEIKRKAGPHTKAVIATHLWGIPADMDPILRVAKLLGLAVIEDCSHAHGAKYKGRLVGTIGDIGCFSLQASKAIVAGEGGVMITNSKRYYQRAMIPGHHGARLYAELTYKDLQPFAPGSGNWKYRASPLGMAIATEQLKRLDHLNAARQANFDRLHERLSKSVPFLKWPRLAKGSRRGWYGTPSFYTYDRKRVSADLFAEACGAEGMGLGRGYENWYQAPLFQDRKLYSQMWVVRHENGVEFRQLPPNGLPRDEELRTKLLVFPIPAIQSPDLMDQMASAVEKVAGQMAALAREQKKRDGK